MCGFSSVVCRFIAYSLFCYASSPDGVLSAAGRGSAWVGSCATSHSGSKYLDDADRNWSGMCGNVIARFVACVLFCLFSRRGFDQPQGGGGYRQGGGRDVLGGGGSRDGRRWVF